LEQASVDLNNDDDDGDDDDDNDDDNNNYYGNLCKLLSTCNLILVMLQF